MMKKIAVFTAIIALALFVYLRKGRVEESIVPNPTRPTSTVRTDSTQDTEYVKTDHVSIFVPYWSVGQLDESAISQYDKLLYFGIAVNENGVNTGDTGYQQLPTFTSIVPSEKSYLTLRMLDTAANLSILEDRNAQDRIIKDVIEIVQNNDVQGIVLDLELSAIPFTDVQSDITVFVQHLSQSLKEHNTELSMTIYGDTFYRTRPYDLKALNGYVDEFYIMSYDFHKSRGEPGPNFPLSGKEKYGYDFKNMISDLTVRVPADKLTIVYGMYGYNWTLGPQGKPLKQAVAQTLNDIRSDYYPTCNYKDCKIVRDSISGETNITYTDDEGYKRVVWYEDEESVTFKEQYANEQGISGKGYWTFGYF